MHTLLVFTLLLLLLLCCHALSPSHALLLLFMLSLLLPLCCHGNQLREDTVNVDINTAFCYDGQLGALAR